MPNTAALTADVMPTRIPTGRRTKRPQHDDDGPVDYAFRDWLPGERHGQLTRQGSAKVGLHDARLAACEWFILRTVPREEMRATLILERQGLAVLYPRHAIYRRKNRYSRSKLGILRPLMVRYLFVGFCAQPNWLETLACSSVTGFVALNEKPLPLAYERIAAFMRGHRLHDAPDHHKHMITHQEFEVGERVEALDGPLRGLHLTVEAIKGSHAKAILTLFGRQQSVDLPLDILVPVRA